METGIEQLGKQEIIDQYLALKEEKDTLAECYSLLQQSHTELESELQKFRHELAELKRLIFGSKSERFVPVGSDDQLALQLDVEERSVEVTTQQVSYTRRKTENKQRPSRQPLPAHLPRNEIIIEPPTSTEGLERIGEEITEELEYKPGKLFVNKYVRPKYLIKKETEADKATVLIGSLPSRPIEKGIAGPGLLAQIAIDKFVDHLPIYRQGKRYEREGMRIPASTLGDWLTHTCELLEPLYEALRKQVLSSDYIQVDETPIRVLDKTRKKKTHQGYHWVYHTPEKRLVLFDYRRGRGREGPKELLTDFQGYLQADGYSVYEWFGARKGITLCNCMAHARREFEHALDNDRERAEYVLTKMGELYQTERTAREAGMTAGERVNLRKKESLPVLKELKTWMEEAYKEVLPKSPVGKALYYSLNRWDRLSLYCQDGRLEIDNNLVENAIRPNALGRKNYLFAGSHKGAQRAAMFYSFFGTCAKHNVNPYEWLREVLEKIADHPVSKVSELLPNAEASFEYPRLERRGSAQFAINQQK